MTSYSDIVKRVPVLSARTRLPPAMKLFCFQGMCGGYTSGLQVAIATTKAEAIDYIVKQYLRDNSPDQKQLRFSIVHQLSGSEGRYFFHSGTWEVQVQHLVNSRNSSKSISIDVSEASDDNSSDSDVDYTEYAKILREQLNKRDPIILPLKCGTVAYCGGAD